MRHSKPTIRLRVYLHMFPDSDESSRLAVSAIMAQRPQPDAEAGT